MTWLPTHARLAVAATALVVLLAACSSGVRDLTLAEVMNPENAAKLREELTVDEQMTLAMNMGAHLGEMEKVTVGEVLDKASKNK